jgi:exodeoxyribonuclease VII small subunit
MPNTPTNQTGPTEPHDGDPADATLTFEEAQAQLEAIIARIESGEAGLEEALASYERGVRLLKHCRAMLDKAEQSFTDLTAQVQSAVKS